MRKILLATVFLLVICVTLVYVLSTHRVVTSAPKLLTDPFLQLPTENSVRVVWFTEFAGAKHLVKYGENNQQTTFTTTKLSRTREDQQSHVGTQTKEGEFYQKPVIRDIWRHEAEVVGLTAGKRVPYSVTSVREDGESVSSNVFTLAAKPTPGTPLKILLTSDHQLKPMIAANLQKVVQTVGQVDAVFFAGDLVDIADRASEWFDDNRGGAFFPCLQGRAKHEIEFNGVKTAYTGGKIIQYAPMFTSIGNHEVMGRFGKSASIGADKDYVKLGDPNALEPVAPTITPLLGDDGKPLPYIASNEITVFSILDTGSGTVSSYRFDTRNPESAVIKFDEFTTEPL